ncbi:hypothetical protein [Spirillospora sp. NPDC047279]|uniref:LppU/SCO3897 family protein n=1 Tax=Spirillospora sp. NPDC047279 TaxID=3155478 RepID=UPI003407BD30
MKAERRKGTWGKRLSIAAMLMFFGAFAGGAILVMSRVSSAPEPGDCLEAEGRGGKTGVTTEFHVVPCEAPNAAYKVVYLGSELGCDDNTYGSTSERSGRQRCLMLNAKAGDCFYQEVGFPTGKVTKVACGPGASYRVVSVVQGKTDHTVCGPNVNPLEREDFNQPLAFVYPKPGLTICTTGA